MKVSLDVGSNVLAQPKAYQFDDRGLRLKKARVQIKGGGKTG